MTDPLSPRRLHYIRQTVKSKYYPNESDQFFKRNVWQVCIDRINGKLLRSARRSILTAKDASVLANDDRDSMTTNLN